ncbi:hypothetical protein [Psychrobacter immobilis]|uniref:hypothetical protein n=1 Tax=Psychrobacter immobilis TaxID=498 RepID=UPI001D12BE83|nr:hypothetical protein [Psychrobacter immobilis]
MSSYSFSPQFYQRWTCAPDLIRASIIQELTDITTLLQHDTPFETFVFSTHDLDAHLDNLYENHEAEQAIVKAIADKKAQEQAAAEKQRLEAEQRLEKEKQAKAAADTKLKEEAKLKEVKAAQKEQLANHKSASIDDKDISKNVTSKNDTSELEKSVTDSRVDKNQSIETSDAKSDATKTAADTNADKRSIHDTTNAVNIVNDNNMKTVIDKAVADAGIHLSLKDAKLGATPPELIRELEIQIDDYLSEQMMLMSENLKSWLRAEVTQHLSEDKVGTNKDSKKS